jgi:hypothetical protein
MMEAARTSETSVDNYFTRQYIPEDKSKLQILREFISIIVYGPLDIYLNCDFNDTSTASSKSIW